MYAGDGGFLDYLSVLYTMTNRDLSDSALWVMMGMHQSIKKYQIHEF